MINIQDKSECCGCGACAQVCAHGAIKMVPDALGFLYPKTDTALCTDCGLCGKVCTFGKSKPQPFDGQKYLAVRHKNMDTVMSSRSGGAFTALSDAVLENGGAVYGAEFTDDLSVRHSRAVTEESRNRFRGSKYIQSDTDDCFKEVQKDLSSGKTVLFSGTSCQCDALKHFVKDDTGLILVDVLCHGVASPAVWKAYLAKSGRKVKTADFRDKVHFGWKDHRETLYFDDSSRKSSRSFTDLYYKHIMLRPSCAECPFNSTGRISDLTLADFWGWEKTDPQLNADDKGYSLLFINSNKGDYLFNKIKDRVFWRGVDISTCLQRPLVAQVDRNPLSDDFCRDFTVRGINYILRKYGDQNLKSQLKYLYKQVRKRARKILLGK